jgi:hypothetical protein
VPDDHLYLSDVDRLLPELKCILPLSC